MCGIACLVGGNNVTKNCYKALEKLEYRGYDSAGIAILQRDKIITCKKTGLVKNIRDFSENEESNIAISHTRWATHGIASEKNSHPHVSSSGKFALVHNGIIENYLDIKKELIDSNVEFLSETDSECVVALIDSLKGDINQRVKNAITKIKGSYAIAILDKDNQCVVGFRKNSPLYVAKTDHGFMLASDIICFNGIAKNYYFIKEGEQVVLTKNGIKFLDKDLKDFWPNFTDITANSENIDVGNYKHFMKKEIFETPLVIENIINRYKDGVLLKQMSKLFEGVEEVVLIGCGTAYHSCLYAAHIFEEKLRIKSKACIASEYKYSNPIINGKTVAIFVSQSGETADTLGCAELLKGKGIKLVAVTNVLHSALANMCDCVLPVCAGIEIAVASTKAYIGQILVLYIMAQYLYDENYRLIELEKLINESKKQCKIDRGIIELIKNAKHVFFIGRQLDYVTALESSLKLKEISYKTAEGYASGELKHGSIALVEKGTPVVIFLTDKNLLLKNIGTAEEVRSRGAKIIFVAPKNYEVKTYDYKIDLPDDCDSDLLSVLAIIPFQLLAYEVSVLLGYNPDKPRNLAKSVTVE